MTGGPAKSAFRAALEEVFGTRVAPERVEFAGRTDPSIARDLLALAGVPVTEIDELLAAALDRYAIKLERALPTDPVVVLPGVRSLLETLEAESELGLALLTGNTERGAELKLRSAGLWQHFPLGAFGSDDPDRNRLPSVALRRARKRWNPHLRAHDAVVLGDTPRDVLCGRTAGMDTLAVATGLYESGELRRAGADWVVPDLRNAGFVLNRLKRRRRTPTLPV